MMHLMHLLRHHDPARQPVDPRHRHHVAGDKGLQEPQQLAPGGLRAARLLPIFLGAPLLAQLRKLSI